MKNNVLDEGEFIREPLSREDASLLVLLRESERAYQRKVNQARNAIFFVITFHTLFLGNLFFLNKQLNLPLQEPLMILLFFKIIVFLSLSFLISKQPKLISGLAFGAVVLDVISQMILRQNTSNFFFFIIINAFLARGFEVANKLEIVRSRIISLGEEPTF